MPSYYVPEVNLHVVVNYGRDRLAPQRSHATIFHRLHLLDDYLPSHFPYLDVLSERGLTFRLLCVNISFPDLLSLCEKTW